MKTFVTKEFCRFMEKPITEAGPYDAIIKTMAALVCTCNSHTFRGAIGPRKPLTLVHEAVGTVRSAAM